jgi:hypothetical protein
MEKMKTPTTPFPKTDGIDMFIPVLNRAEIEHWKKEAEQADYDKKFERMASNLFFNGGKLPMRPDITKEEYSAGRAYLRKWLGSWDPKHETKELVAGYILSRISTVSE